MFTPTEEMEKSIFFLIDPRISVPMYLGFIFITPQQYRAYWFIVWFGGCVLSTLLGPTPIRGSEGRPRNRFEYISQQVGFSLVYWFTIAGLIAAAIDNLFLS
jgi:hypothetical protein